MDTLFSFRIKPHGSFIMHLRIWCSLSHNATTR